MNHEGHEEHEGRDNKSLELPAFSLFFLRVLRVLRGSKSRIRIAVQCLFLENQTRDGQYDGTV